MFPNLEMHYSWIPAGDCFASADTSGPALSPSNARPPQEPLGRRTAGQEAGQNEAPAGAEAWGKPKKQRLLGGGCFGGFGLAGVGLGILAAEALDAAGGVDQLLLAGKEGVAGGADFHADVALVGGTGHKGVAAGTVHAGFVVSRMDGWLHGTP